MSALRHILPLLLCPAAALGLRAQDARVAHTDSVEIQFHQSKWDIDPDLGDNRAVLDSIHRRLAYIQGDSIFSISHVSVTGAASPEGSETFNRFLSEKRAGTLFDHLSRYGKLADADRTYVYKGHDWQRVLELVEKDSRLPYKEKTLNLLRDIAGEKELTGKEPDNSLNRIRRLRGGVPYSYLYRHVFPRVRASRLVLAYSARPFPAVTDPCIVASCHIDSMPAVEYLPAPPPAQSIAAVVPASPFYMAVRTNMLYDLLLLPNIGVDFYLGKGLTVGANWMYAWWSDVRKDRIWRAYGGELNMRWFPWCMTKRETPFNGHHFGLYGQIYTYDFEWGKKGEMGGKPLGSLGDRSLWSAGIEYGYTLPVAKRLSIDFSLGVGYTTGIFIKYSPDHVATGDIHYVWDGTHRRRFFGPTKAEIALVWLIGRGNNNRKGGGE